MARPRGVGKRGSRQSLTLPQRPTPRLRRKDDWGSIHGNVIEHSTRVCSGVLCGSDGSFASMLAVTHPFGIPGNISYELAAVLVECNDLLDVEVPHEGRQLGVVPNFTIGRLAPLSRIAWRLSGYCNDTVLSVTYCPLGFAMEERRWYGSSQASGRRRQCRRRQQPQQGPSTCG